jgi:YidC/Oxa1 family membrane protein insertase
MDRNSIIGLVLISAIIFGWMIWSQPSKEDLARMQAQRDSLELVQRKADEAARIKQQEQAAKAAALPRDESGKVPDSVMALVREQIYGKFSNASKGKNETYTIENDVMKVFISARGGYITHVILKDYYEYPKDSVNGVPVKKPLVLFTPDSSFMRLAIQTDKGQLITDSLYFRPVGKPVKISGSTSGQFSLRLETNDPSKYLEYVYTISGNDYMMDYRINMVGLQDVLIAGDRTMRLQWGQNVPSHEKSVVNERETSTVYYKYMNGEVSSLNERVDEKKTISEDKVKWISFKQQFFTSVLIAEKEFGPVDAATYTNHASVDYVRSMVAELSIPFKRAASETFGMRMYFGPNHYRTLKQYDLDLERQIPLGWGIFGWVNRGLVIPVFNWLNGFDMNFGLIILILTIIIKIILFPVAYKMYISSAKMRVLKPEIDEINKKHEGGDPMKKQQEIMALYKQAGVNPMAGCVPLLLQLPILIALVSFFPSSIELRQESFLWAEDLSTYDSLIQLPFSIPFLGSHLSLFALLMTVSTIVYTWYNSQLMGTSANQMPGMKVMMYIMPVLFLGFLNSRSSGLSYYYLLANIISIGQAILMQRFVDQDALHRKIEEYKKKPKKASKWQQKMEEIMKQSQQRQAQLKKGDNKDNKNKKK